MASLTFGTVPASGFIGYSADLAKDDWALIDVSAYDGPNRTALKDLSDAPVCVKWKLQFAWALGAVLVARDGAGSSKECDVVWDGAQKKLNGLITAAGHDQDPKKSAAAGRLHKVLTKGAGTAQTKMTYQQEVDFGRQQMKTTSSDQPALDVALLGFGPMMKEIDAATEALADAIGHGQGSDRPSERLRAATAECSAVFSLVSGDLDWVANNGAAGADRQRAARLLETLAVLVGRYPAPAAPAPAAPAPAGPAKGP